ncbi:hypothetical protein HZ326_7814 [Fusarium oxysporum f. sp. albedinis]|nr:hypothetical protein HZ326_7814 [Fusarium oxysporum f. sp. albedinis]
MRQCKPDIQIPHQYLLGISEADPYLFLKPSFMANILLFDGGRVGSRDDGASVKGCHVLLGENSSPNEEFEVIQIQYHGQQQDSSRHPCW